MEYQDKLKNVAKLSDDFAKLKKELDEAKKDLLEEMKDNGVKTDRESGYTFSLTTQAPDVLIDDIDDVPQEYLKSELDKAKIRKAIANGEQVDFAVLKEKPFTISIRKQKEAK